MFCTIRTITPAATHHIDLNADVGESFGAYVIGDDEQLLRAVTSANVAAGFHGGDPTNLRQTLRLARASGVRVGAHPGFPDLAGFGRRELQVTPEDAEDFVLYQIAAVAGVARAEGLRLQHVKPHGALYNMAARDARLAAAIVRAVRLIDESLIVFGPPRSKLLDEAQRAGLRVAAEGFADRAYDPDGSLAARSIRGSLITDETTLVDRAIRMVKEQVVLAHDGSEVPMPVQTICIHGDTPGAGRLAARLRQGLHDAGIVVRPIEASVVSSSQ